jgi:hypothetical protein
MFNSGVKGLSVIGRIISWMYVWRSFAFPVLRLYSHICQGTQKRHKWHLSFNISYSDLSTLDKNRAYSRNVYGLFNHVTWLLVWASLTVTRLAIRQGSLQQWRILMRPCWCVCGKNLNIVSMCAVSPVVHTSNISSCKKLFVSFPVAVN